MLLLTVLSPNDCFISFTQTHEECELKIIEQEKEVTILPPKDACKCHKEDLAKALNVRVFTHLPAWGGETSPCRDVCGGRTSRSVLAPLELPQDHSTDGAGGMEGYWDSGRKLQLLSLHWGLALGKESIWCYNSHLTPCVKNRSLERLSPHNQGKL